MAGFVHILPKIGLKQPSIFYLSHQQTANTNTHTHTLLNYLKQFRFWQPTILVLLYKST